MNTKYFLIIFILNVSCICISLAQNDSDNNKQYGEQFKKTDSLSFVSQVDTTLKPLEQYFSQIDKTLDTTLAATLAGLSLAISTFLLTLVISAEDKFNVITINRGEIPDYLRMQVVELKKALRNVLIAFYCFVGVIVESLTLDMWEEPNSLLGNIEWANLTDIGLSLGLFGFGLFFLSLGAKAFFIIFYDRDKKNKGTKDSNLK
ncbi:MAG: hypothetical protein K8I03_11620 [Ignavibacteria bacterium]|nr:hypothetical protein [Ignavibacteria bacterium]